MRIVTLLVVALSCLVSCSSSNQMKEVNANLKRYEQFLALHVEAPAAIESGTDVAVSLTLENTASTTISGCWYKSASVHLVGIEPGYLKAVGFGTIWGHPYCESSFHLNPGQTVSFTQTVKIPNVPSGTASISANVSVVYPRRCDSYGCYDTSISGRTQKPISVKGGA